MDEPSGSALRYGHLGRATYVPEKRSWVFTRTLSPPSPISYAGVTKTTIPPPVSIPGTSSSSNELRLQRIHPTLAAGGPVADSERLSHAVAVTNEICDPQVSTLVDFGHAVDVDLEHDRFGRKMVAIAAVATGECRSAISFRVLEQEPLDPTQVPPQLLKSSALRIPCVGKADTTEWSAGGAPVRQVCFANALQDPATWVAARFPRMTILFQPLYHQRPVPVYFDYDNDRTSAGEYCNARLEPNPVIEISISQTGGFAHADVTFNPWYQQQFGIVDGRGNWSIWEISGLKRNINASCITSGALPWLDTGDIARLDDSTRHDGWASIEWAGDFSSFVVADRRCLMLYRMEGDHISAYSAELSLKRKSEWILDIKRSPHNASHVFVLTTIRILWLDVAPADGEGKRLPLTPRLAWHHFRDVADITLRLSPLALEGDLYLLLYSRLNHCVLVFQCRVSSEGQIDVEAPDPFILNVPAVFDESTGSGISLPNAQFMTLVVKEVVPFTKPDRRQDDIDFKLIKLFTLDSGLAFHESLHIGTSGNREPGREALRVFDRRARLHKSHSRRHADAFVVDDCDDSALIPTAIDSIKPTLMPPMLRPTVNCTQIYAVATGKLPVSKQPHNGQALETSFSQCMGELAHRFHDTESDGQQTTATILEIFGFTPALDDVDEEAQKLAHVTSNLMPQNQMSQSGQSLSVLPLAFTKPSANHASPVPDLVYTYDSLVKDWLSSIPHEIPPRTRIVKENAIRILAADLALARVNVLAIPGDQRGSRRQQQGHNHDPVAPVPDDPAAASKAGLSGRLPSASDVDATQGEKTVQSESVLKEGSASDPKPLATVGQACPNLRSLTIFDEQQPLSAGVANILSHWLPQTDPATYNWQSTAQEIESGDETLQATPKAKPRKKPSRGLSVDTASVSPAPPAIRTWGSQPSGGNPPVKLESSQAVEDDVPMTQVERGTFGGRESNWKGLMKKRRRNAGF